MTIKLINNTAADITLNSTGITIPASGEFILIGSDQEVVALSADFYSLANKGDILISDGHKTLPAQLGIALVRRFRDPIAEQTDFGIEIAAGRVANTEALIVNGYTNTVDAVAFKDVWMAPGVMTTPTTNEVYEIISDSVADASAGTGARTANVYSLDANGVEQNITVTLNGTTAVDVTGLHSFPLGLTILTAGSAGSNVGNITLRAKTTNLTRAFILPSEGKSLSCIFKVPAGKTLYQESVGYHSGGASKPVTVRTRVLYPGTTAWISTLTLPLTQASLTKRFRVTRPYPAGTIIRYQARLESGTDGPIAIAFTAFMKS